MHFYQFDTIDSAELNDSALQRALEFKIKSIVEALKRAVTIEMMVNYVEVNFLVSQSK